MTHKNLALPKLTANLQSKDSQVITNDYTAKKNSLLIAPNLRITFVMHSSLPASSETRFTTHPALTSTSNTLPGHLLQRLQRQRLDRPAELHVDHSPGNSLGRLNGVLHQHRDGHRADPARHRRNVRGHHQCLVVLDVPHQPLAALLRRVFAVESSRVEVKPPERIKFGS